MAKTINAKAFTVGRNIAFGAGEYAPATTAGTKLLAHELTHVLQQRTGVQFKNGLGRQRAGYEQHADRRSAEPLLDHFAPVVAAPSFAGTVQCKEAQTSEETKVEACLLEKWRKMQDHRMAPISYDSKLYGYTLWHSVLRGCLATGAELSVIKATWERVTQGIEDKIVAEIVTKPGIMIGQWQRFVEHAFPVLKTNPALTKFKERVESQLLGAYAAVKVAEAVKGSGGYSARKLESLADIQIRQIIVNHRQDYFAAVSNGVNGWHAPRVPPDHWPSILSGGENIAGGISSIVYLGTGVAVAAVLAPLLAVVGIGLGIASAWSSIKNADEAHRQQLLEDAIREETLRGFERKVEMIEATEDALAVVLAVEALKEGIDLKNIARAKLRAFCWEKMFGKFPEDQTKGRQEVQAAMSKELDGKLKG